jgi:hypothetical protein
MGRQLTRIKIRNILLDNRSLQLFKIGRQDRENKHIEPTYPVRLHDQLASLKYIFEEEEKPIYPYRIEQSVIYYHFRHRDADA